MKRLFSFAATCSCALGLAAGCSRTEVPPPKTEPPSATTAAPPAQPPQNVPANTPTPMPPPDPARSDASTGPKPGQANDHSSPAFKSGGKEETRK